MVLEGSFPVECLEDIFRHFKGRYLIECTKVAPEWNNLIGSTKWCMQRFGIRLFSWEKSEDILKMLQDTKRKYESLTIFGDFDDFRLFLTKNERQWTQVFSHLHFRNANRFLEFLEIIEPSIQNLDLEPGTIKQYVDQYTLERSLDCSRAEKLKFPYV